MDKLIFIDTNVFLDFYRIRNSDISLKYLDLIDKNHDKIIISDQVEMEFKKHRLEIIQESLKALKPPDLNNSVPPAIVSDAEPAKIIEKLKSLAQKQHKKLKDRIHRVLENPSANDKVYQTLQRLFKDKDSELNLHRENPEKYRIRKLAFKRFFLGCPPRKKSDTSIGDALNWEWIIKCCKDKYKNVIIISRDNDYGIHFDNKSLINDFLNQEFKDRVSNRKSVTFTNKLSVAFKGISSPEVTKQMETVEKEIIVEENLSVLSDKKIILNQHFWNTFKGNLMEMFNEENIDNKKEE
jgi:predicted nucleic acid-binding protein